MSVASYPAALGVDGWQSPKTCNGCGALPVPGDESLECQNCTRANFYTERAKPPSPPPSVADSACSLCSKHLAQCDGDKPRCSHGCDYEADSVDLRKGDRDDQHAQLPPTLEPHRDFIQGVRRIYNLLVAMRYIPESELIWPPHDKLHSVLAPLGFDSRVIQILCHIPFLKNTVIQRASPELDHGTYGINYLDSGEAEDMLEVSRPDEILLFKSCSDFGNFYVYNVSSQTMKLATPFQLYSKEQGRNEFDRLSPRPAAKVLGDLADSFTNLTLVPMRGLSGFQLSSSLPGSDTEIKRLYARNGWPRKFNGEQFEKDLAAWLERESQKGPESIARMTRVSAVEAQTGAPNTKSMRSTRSLRERLHMIRRKSTFA
ncbi:uncharacterized protein IWZ02DRAFT_90752 [Phyllosticta citriasiana]|uniref:Uncharacterized protein n=1 Tax=Phyllosticta citriasiana TaxID=595635 RepID=A0ABR1L0F8_9PEZI